MVRTAVRDSGCRAARRPRGRLRSAQLRRTKDEHAGHRDEDGGPRGQERVEEDGKRLVGARVDKQQRHEQQMVVLDDRVHAVRGRLIALELLPVLQARAVVHVHVKRDLELLVVACECEGHMRTSARRRPWVGARARAHGAEQRQTGGD